MHSGGRNIFFYPFFKIGKSIPARTWGNVGSDGVVRWIFASRAMLGTHRAP
jgi:hypothetical protein